MTLLAVSDATTITISITAAIVLVVLLIILRVIFRREPSPPSWLRIRVGVFLERDPNHHDDQTRS